ncbi:hypothetical protein IRJ41_012843, partial [Triplophysa rosa]
NSSGKLQSTSQMLIEKKCHVLIARIRLWEWIKSARRMVNKTRRDIYPLPPPFNPKYASVLETSQRLYNIIDVVSFH